MSTIWIINQYASTPATGLGGRHHHLARELAARGHRVYLIGAQWHHLLREGQATDAAPLTERVDGYEFLRVPTPRYAHAHDKRRMLNWILFAWRLTALHRRIPDPPDAIMCSSPSLFAILGAERLARRFSARLVFEVRDIWPLTLVEVGGLSPRHPMIRLMQWVEDWAYRRADRVVSNLPGAASHMVSRGMEHTKFSWVPNGFSTAEIERPQPLEDDVRAMIPAGKFVVGYAGTLGAANALDTLLDAAEMLRAYEDISFVLLGQGKEKKALQLSASRRNLTNIHFLPAVPKDQVQSVLEHFDVCSLGLKAESLFRFGVSPNKLFDYLVSGKPIIYGIDSGHYRPVEDFRAGIQVPPGDAAALADAILKLRALKPAERRRMGENGRRAVLEQHEYGMLAGKLEAVMLGSDALEERGGPGINREIVRRPAGVLPVKRVFDIVLSGSALLVLAPLLLGLWLAVRWRMGSPALFRQVRPGLKGRPFEMIKFRTMRDASGPDGTPLPDAERLTSFGRWLRATSLDELPELWNVLKGEMSLVGPRPLLMEYLPLYSHEQRRRHEVRPGVTGWAQVNGRNAVSWTRKFELDVWYVERHNLWLDVKIIVMTIGRILKRDGISAPGSATADRFEG